MPNWLMPILKLIVYPGLAVMAQKLLIHWGVLQSVPYLNHLPSYILYGLMLLLKNPLTEWVKTTGA